MIPNTATFFTQTGAGWGLICVDLTRNDQREKQFIINNLFLIITLTSDKWAIGQEPSGFAGICNSHLPYSNFL
jgi:hypothetical protein